MRGISLSAWQLSEYSLLSPLIFLQVLKNITIHYMANETFANGKKKELKTFRKQKHTEKII